MRARRAEDARCRPYEAGVPNESRQNDISP